MAIFGRRPGSVDIGMGHMEPGRARGAIMGRPSSNGWLYRFGGRVGKQIGSANATYYHALYATSGDTNITTHMRASVAGTAAAVMDYGGAGSNQTVRATSPVQIYSRYSYALVTRVASGNFAHGQDHSGHRMHDRTGAGSSFPSPFNASHVRPEGKPSFWVEFQPNRAPNTPSGLSPAGTVSGSSPTLAANFRDPDEVLPGFSVGQADTVKSYRFEVWNSANTSRLRDSGVRASTAGQRSARRVTWNVGSSLNAGTYRARVTVWDQFDVPSRTATWVFTINAGGAIEGIVLHPLHQIAPGLTNGVRPFGQFTWRHGSGLQMQEVEAQIAVHPSRSVIRARTSRTMTVASGATADINFNWSPPEWGDIARGRTIMYQARGRDSEGMWSPWASSEPIVVNAPPNVPTFRSPNNVTVSERPSLTAEVYDPNDDEESLIVEFAVRPAGSTGAGVSVPHNRNYRQNDRWWTDLTAAEMPSHGQYEWRVRGTDPWGSVGPWSSWLEFGYAAAPTVTIPFPANNSTITTGTPWVGFTVDRSTQTYEVRIHRADTRQLVWQYASFGAGTGIQIQVAEGVLRNNVEYDIEVHVVTMDGLTGWARTTITVAYTQPSALATFTAETVAGPFEPDADPSQWSRIALEWSEVTSGQVPSGEFAGYLIRRLNLATNEETLLAHLHGRGDTVFVDRTPTSGVAYEYQVTYLRIRNLVDTLESAPRTVQHSVTLTNTVLVSMDDDDIGVPLRYWRDRDPKPERDWEVVPSFGQHPVAFQGRLDHLVIRGTFQTMDDPYGTFTAQDIRRTVEELGAPNRSVEDQPRGRVVNYRDPKQRNVMAIIRDTDPMDQHANNRAEFGLELVQINAVEGVDMPEGVG